MRVLVVEDEAEIREFLKHSLTEAGCVVEVATTAAEGEQAALGARFDVMVVDLGLPDSDGLNLILRLRQQDVTTPVLILSARRTVDDRVRGLEEGGDDYLVKPFAFAELLARLRNLTRRASQASAPATRLNFGTLDIDLLRRDVTLDGQKLQLTQQEFALLEYLCRQAGRVVTRTMILREVWGMQFQPETNVVDVHIYRLRSKLEGSATGPTIKTKRGVGYVLEAR